MAKNKSYKPYDKAVKKIGNIIGAKELQASCSRSFKVTVKP